MPPYPHKLFEVGLARLSFVLREMRGTCALAS